MRRNLRRAFFGALAVMVLVLASAVPASADGRVSTDPSHFGHAEFFDYGEHLYACDDYPDGMRVTVLYRQRDEFWSYLDDANGAANSCGHADLDLEEGSGLYVQVCRRDGAVEIFEDCGTEAFFTA